MQLIENQEG